MKTQSNKVLLIVFGIVILIIGISPINSNRARTYSNTSVTVVSEAADGEDRADAYPRYADPYYVSPCWGTVVSF